MWLFSLLLLFISNLLVIGSIMLFLGLFKNDQKEV